MKGGNFKRNKVMWAVILIVNFFASWIIREAASDLLLSLSYVQLFATPWIAACQASLSFTISQSFLKLWTDYIAKAARYLLEMGLAACINIQKAGLQEENSYLSS